MTLIVFLILLPAVVVLTATWAWRYQLRSLDLVGSRDPDTVKWAEVRLQSLAVTDAERVALTLERRDEGARRDVMLVAVDEPSAALSTLRAWHDAQEPLVVIYPAGRRIVRFRSVDTAESLTLRRVEG